MDLIDDTICRRAIAFAKTFMWIAPRITATAIASPEIIERFGTVGSAQYGEVVIELEWPDAERSRILDDAARDDLSNITKFLDEPMKLRVTCSSTDVIHHNFPNIDLD